MNEILKKLNSPEYLPQIAYRRNHNLYELVCYVNCLIGCRLSGNAEGQDVFKNRIKQYMDDHPPAEMFEKYYNVVSAYLINSEGSE